MDVNLAKFKRALAGIRRVGLDTQILIYHLEDVAPYSELTTYLLAEASVPAMQLLLSVVSLSEILVKPWQEGDGERAGHIRMALESLPGLQFAVVTTDVAVDGAALRGQAGLPLPDALIVSSVLERGAQAVVTNEKEWTKRRLPCRVLVLDDYIRR